MRLHEIEASNEIWAKFNGVELNLSRRYHTMKNLIAMLNKSSNLSMTRGYAPLFDRYFQAMNDLIAAPFPDPSDPDIMSMKHEARQQLIEITKLWEALPK